MLRLAAHGPSVAWRQGQTGPRVGDARGLLRGPAAARTRALRHRARSAQRFLNQNQNQITAAGFRQNTATGPRRDRRAERQAVRAGGGRGVELRLGGAVDGRQRAEHPRRVRRPDRRAAAAVRCPGLQSRPVCSAAISICAGVPDSSSGWRRAHAGALPPTAVTLGSQAAPSAKAGRQAGARFGEPHGLPAGLLPRSLLLTASCPVPPPHCVCPR